MDIIINLKKNDLKNKRTFCKNCNSFMFETVKDGYINFPHNVISSDGECFILQCRKCKEKMKVYFK